MKAKINIDTLTKINDFVSIVAKLNCDVRLIDGGSYCVSAKSLIGAIATMDWSEVFVECKEDIYNDIKDFVVVK
jgi:hypothetical protein